MADSPLFIPKYKTAGAACADLVANIPGSAGTLHIAPGDTEVVDCGFQMALPPGWEAQVRCRSGLAKRGLQVANGVGTLDSDYRGRVTVLLYNSGNYTIILSHGERVAQIALKPVWHFAWDSVDELDETERGSGGFGSTGTL